MKIMMVFCPAKQRKELSAIATNVFPDAEINFFFKRAEAVKYAQKHVVDVVFIDMDKAETEALELGNQLKEVYERINMIFLVSKPSHMTDTIDLRASGYLRKPLRVRRVQEELKNLRYAPAEPSGGLRAVTFGNFELLANGIPVHFSRSKSKELLAFLVDMGGTGVTKKEAAAVLFEDSVYDEKIQDYVKKVVRSLRNDLKKIGAEEILMFRRNFYAVDRTKFSCDLYEFEKGENPAKNAFRGAYMTQYGWGERTLGWLTHSEETT